MGEDILLCSDHGFYVLLGETPLWARCGYLYVKYMQLCLAEKRKVKTTKPATNIPTCTVVNSSAKDQQANVIWIDSPMICIHVGFIYTIVSALRNLFVRINKIKTSMIKTISNHGTPTV